MAAAALNDPYRWWPSEWSVCLHKTIGEGMRRIRNVVGIGMLWSIDCRRLSLCGVRYFGHMRKK